MLNELEQKIRKAIPELNELGIGCEFNSTYYGIIVATQVEHIRGEVYSIYGFDKKQGLPRSNYYPIDITLIGKPIQLNHVLLYVRRLNAKEHKYSEVDLESKITDVLKRWRLDKNLLSDQSSELIKFINEL